MMSKEILGVGSFASHNKNLGHLDIDVHHERHTTYRSSQMMRRKKNMNQEEVTMLTLQEMNQHHQEMGMGHLIQLEGLLHH